MQCPYCHADDQEGRFCKVCGKPLDADASDLTRVMPPLDALHDTTTNATSKGDTEAAAPEPDTTAADTADAPQDGAHLTDDGAGATPAEDASESAPALPAFLLETDEKEAAALKDSDEETPEQARKRKILTAAALIIGIALAAIAAVYLFTDLFDTTPQTDPTEALKNAEVVAPDTSLPEDTIVGHWRHYNTGSVIEKISASQYRWTIGKSVYNLEFADNQYTYKDESGNTYVFVLTDSDHIQLASSGDSSGGLISKPIFESGYIAGRVGQDGTMAQSMRVNADAFAIVGKTYAELAGIYGPGSLTVIGDNQYIVFRGDGGNFAVQFEGETVPLSAEASNSYSTTTLSTDKGYRVVPMTGGNTTPTTGTEGSNGTSNSTDNTTDPNGSGGSTSAGSNAPTVTTPDTTTGENNSDSTNDNSSQEDTEYTVTIPDMPTFPSTTAVTTGVVWADLGFVIKNAPDTMSVDDLSAVLGIALEVGTAPANESGFNFYGSDEGYFAGTYATGDHSFYISGYGKSALSATKTQLFIQQIS